MVETASIRAHYGPVGRTQVVLSGWNVEDAIPLRDGQFLQLYVSAYLRDDGFIAVKKSKYQYQLDADGEYWVFRYEYDRVPPGDHPACHLHVNGRLEHDVLGGALLGRVHFPTGRMPLEAVLRCLIEEFDVDCAVPSEVWRPALAASEEAFMREASQPLSGPDA